MVRRSTSAWSRAAGAIWPPALFFVLLIGAWKLALASEWISPLILPPPEDIVTSFVKLLFGNLIWGDFGVTLWESAAGFLLGAGLGLALAIPSGLWRTMRRMLTPYAISLQVTPRIAIAPLIVAWAGFGYGSKIWIAAIIAFFPVYVNTLTGLLTVDEELREMFRSLGASKLQTFVKLMVPGSLPVIFAGFKTAAGLSLVGAVVGEFIAAQRGLGVVLLQLASQLEIASVFAIILLLMGIGFLLYLTVEWLERVTVFWLHDTRMAARTRRKAARAHRRGLAALAGVQAPAPRGVGVGKSANKKEEMSDDAG